MDNWTTRTALGLTLAGALALTGCAPEGTDTPGTLHPGQLDPASSTGNQQGASSGASSGNQSKNPSKDPSKQSELSPGEKQPADVATDEPEQLGDIEGRIPVEVEKTTDLPGSFPAAEIPLPENISIDNVGERSDGSWFLVLRSDTMNAAESQIAFLTREGKFTVNDRSPLTSEGFERTLTNDRASVHAYGYVDDVGPVVSLDITMTP